MPDAEPSIWQTAIVTTSSRTTTIATGVLLLIAPLIAIALKLLSFGWMMVLIMMGPALLLIAGYVVQAVIAVQGFLSKRALFGGPGGGVPVPARGRAAVAAWITSIGVMATAILTPDGSDSGYGSTLQLWLGSYGPDADAVHEATDTLNDTLFFIAAAVWVLGFVWQFVAWIMALVQRRRERRAGPGAR